MQALSPFAGELSKNAPRQRAVRSSLPTKNAFGIELISPTLAVALVAVTGSYAIGDERYGNASIALLGVAGIMVVWDISWRKIVPRIHKSSLSFVPLVALCFASTAWSLQPDISLQAAVRLLLIIVIGTLVGLVTPIDRQLLTLAVLAVMWALAAIVAVTFGVEGAIDADSRGIAWRGSFVSKNSLGRAEAFGLLAILALLLTCRTNRVRWVLAAGLCVAAIWFSMSVASWIIPLAILVRVIASSNQWLRIAFALGLYVFGTVIMRAVAQFADLVSRDATLTGRVPLWRAVEELAAQRPVLGYGYDAVWTSELGYAVTVTQGWTVGHSHNGMLDMRLALGWSGVVAMCLILGVAVKINRSNRWNWWPAALASGIILSDLVEVTSLSGLSILLLSAAVSATSADHGSKDFNAHSNDRLRV